MKPIVRRLLLLLVDPFDDFGPRREPAHSRPAVQTSTSRRPLIVGIAISAVLAIRMASLGATDHNGMAQGFYLAAYFFALPAIAGLAVLIAPSIGRLLARFLPFRIIRIWWRRATAWADRAEHQ